LFLFLRLILHASLIGSYQDTGAGVYTSAKAATESDDDDLADVANDDDDNDIMGYLNTLQEMSKRTHFGNVL